MVTETSTSAEARNSFGSRSFVVSLCALAGSLMIGCAGPSENFLADDESRLATGGNLAKYHYLVREPYSIGLNHAGFIIGIEKSPNGLIGYPFGRGYDDDRFRPWNRGDDNEGGQYLEARNDHFRRVTDDPKSVYVSHILEYGLGSDGAVLTEISPLYLAYEKSGFAGQTNGSPCAPKPGGLESYAKTWKALDCLYDVAADKLEKARGPKRYTHLIIASMGWNNDQVESVRRYNALAGNLIAQARQDSAYQEDAFKPLFIGLTWPSVWGGDSFFNTLNLFNHVISYPNKADDADEIGYTIVNYLLNDIILRLKNKYRLKTVLIGHSLGARILSRAMFSAHLLKNPPDEEGQATDLMLNLQGAYSVRRYKENHRLAFPLTLFNKGEGSPYLIRRKLRGKIVLTWSRKDTANPLAQFVTGAAHVGGRAGYEEALEIKDTFTHLVWKEDTNIRPDCAKHRDDGKVLMVNANSFVHDHNDILDPRMGDFIWQAIFCFASGK